jgi:transcription initiation factor TFIID subunit 8
MSGMLLERGFQSAHHSCIETLSEMMQSFINELGRSAQSLAELCGRTEPLFVDVFIALVEMGLDTAQLYQFGRRGSRVQLPAPTLQAKQGAPKILQAGERRALAHYIPEHFPQFPDAHSYIRTPTYKQPITEYEAIREKASSQKRDVERALTRFMAKTCDVLASHSLFPEEQSAHVFPLISLNLKNQSYLTALLPCDQIFDGQDESKHDGKGAKRVGDKGSRTTLADGDTTEDLKDMHDESALHGDTSMNRSDLDAEISENPFLRPTKICRRNKK